MTKLKSSYAMASLALLVACGGGNIEPESTAQSTQEFNLSGTMTGMNEGEEITLHNKASNATVVSTNGNFSFTTLLAYNTDYAVTVGTQPTGQHCTVHNGTGSAVVSDVGNLSITCISLNINNA